MPLQALSWLRVGKGWLCTEQGCWGVQRQLGVCWGALCRVGQADLPCPELCREAGLALPCAQWPIPCTGFPGSASACPALCMEHSRQSEGGICSVLVPNKLCTTLCLFFTPSSFQASTQSCFQVFMSSVKQGTAARQAKTP